MAPKLQARLGCVVRLTRHALLRTVEDGSITASTARQTAAASPSTCDLGGSAANIDSFVVEEEEEEEEEEGSCDGECCTIERGNSETLCIARNSALSAMDVAAAVHLQRICRCVVSTSFPSSSDVDNPLRSIPPR
tara:strand:- start:69 stop:473 length:405 start_codon:yes stop_codon:yes gene_type:complete